MANWNDILLEISGVQQSHDTVRRKYLEKMHEYTKRNVIIYYSGWLQKPNIKTTGINDADKNGFMAVINKLNRKKGLDLVLHTQGGGTAATESIVDYLKSMFGSDIRAFIPQLAMSAGTMIACACKEIFMGKHSSLGPIDPQFGNIAAHGVVEEFYRAHKEIKKDPSLIPVWQPIIANYSPTFIGECEKAIKWSEEMVTEWLEQGMFNNEKNKKQKVKKIVKELISHDVTKSHDRHISMEKCKEIGLKISALEKDAELQDAVLSLHHACIHTLSGTGASKIIENHTGKAYIDIAQAQLQQMLIQK